MGLRRQLRRHGKDNRLIIGVLAVLLVVLSAVFFFIQRSQQLDPQIVTNRVLLFALWYVNVVLILAVLFYLARAVFKLLLERRARILGSKFKIKLVLTYFGLSLIPVLLLFLVSTQLLRGSVDRWFSTPLREVLSDGNAVAQELARRIERSNQQDAERVLEAISDLDLTEPASRPALNRRMRRFLDEFGLDYLAVYQGTEFVNAVVNSQAEIADLPELDQGFLMEAILDGSSRGQPRTPVDGLLILGAVSPGTPAGDQPPVIVAGRLLDPELAESLRQVIQSFQGYRQIEVQRDDLQGSYLLIFLMLTLVILLASSWVGLFLARRVTVPIQALAEGTRRISGGDLGHRVDVEADDELGVLVTSFNRMTGELERKETLLERSNRELQATNERLDEERALIAAVLENVAAGVISCDAEGRIFTCNSAALAMLRQRESEVLGRPVTEAWPEGERAKLRAVLDEAGTEGGVARKVQLHLDGAWSTFEAKVTPIGGADERLGLVMVLEDLTELIEAQQLAAWREAARRIAHEIKNPLTPIQLAAERLLRKHQRGDEDLGPALEEGVEIIGREVRTLQSMVDDFSRYARMPRARPEATAIGGLLEETADLYRNLKPGVEVTCQVDPPELEAWIDRDQIRRALINLLDNALEATEAPGTVHLAALPRGKTVRIEVRDTGRGIPPEAQEKLFLPYFSTKGRGTGLGLSIVHRIVSEHRGRITVEANRPKGTVFHLDLPTR